MRFLKKIFTAKKEPDNSRLIFLLNNWRIAPSTKAYELVMKEMISGNGYLLLPSVKNDAVSTDWSISKDKASMQLTTVDERDGFKVLWAFTDEDSLSNWAKEPTAYTAFKSQDVLKLCEREEIDRIVINIDSPNVFLVQRKN